MEDTRSRLGITELVNHNLVSSYPVLWERNGEIIAQFKFTVLILPTTTKRLNEGFDLPWVTSDFKYESDPVLEQIMAMGIAKKKQRKRRKNQTKTKTKTKINQIKINQIKINQTKILEEILEEILVEIQEKILVEILEEKLKIQWILLKIILIKF